MAVAPMGATACAHASVCHVVTKAYLGVFGLVDDEEVEELSEPPDPVEESPERCEPPLPLRWLRQPENSSENFL